MIEFYLRNSSCTDDVGNFSETAVYIGGAYGIFTVGRYGECRFCLVGYIFTVAKDDIAASIIGIFPREGLVFHCNDRSGDRYGFFGR